MMFAEINKSLFRLFLRSPCTCTHFLLFWVFQNTKYRTIHVHWVAAQDVHWVAVVHAVLHQLDCLELVVAVAAVVVVVVVIVAQSLQQLIYKWKNWSITMDKKQLEQKPWVTLLLFDIHCCAGSYLTKRMHAVSESFVSWRFNIIIIWHKFWSWSYLTLFSVKLQLMEKHHLGGGSIRQPFFSEILIIFLIMKLSDTVFFEVTTNEEASFGRCFKSTIFPFRDSYKKLGFGYGFGLA